ncbi:MAG TPA: ATP-binding protein [Chloroflexota bacterium]
MGSALREWLRRANLLVPLRAALQWLRRLVAALFRPRRRGEGRLDVAAGVERAARGVEESARTLRSQVRSLQRAESTAAAQAAELRAVLENVPDAILIVDQGNNLVEANPRAMQLLGLSGREELGRPLAAYAAALDVRWPDGSPVELPAMALTRALKGETVVDQEVSIHLPTSRTLYTLISAAPVRDQRGDVIRAVGVMRDVTEEHLRMRELQAVARLAAVLARQGSLPHVFDVALREFIAILGLEKGAVWLLDQEGKRLRLVAHHLARPETAELIASLPMDQPFLAVEAVRSRQVLAVPDVRAVPGHPAAPLARRVAELERYRRYLAIPLVVGEAPVGVMALVSSAPGPFSVHDLGLARTLGDLLAVAVDRIQLFERSVRHAGELRALLESIDHGVLLGGVDGRVRFVNSVFAQLFDVDRAAVERAASVQALAELLAPQVRVPADFKEVFGNPCQVGQTRQVREVHRAGPRHRVLAWLRAPVLDERQNVIGCLDLFRDVTRERELERLKSEFLLLVSHEFRTPLTVALGNVQLAERLVAAMDSRSAELRERLAGAERGVQRLVSMVQAMLDVLAIEAQRLRLVRERLDLVSLVRDVVDEARPALAMHRLDVVLPAEPVVVEVDRRRIEDVVRNLLVNAGRYTPPGTRVTVTLRRVDGEAVLTVRDAGPGIPPDELSALFNRFRRARMLVGQAREGLGLGLYINREVVKAHGGRLWAESALGQGSAFHVALPLASGFGRGGGSGGAA